jgi:hypothetical protein
MKGAARSNCVRHPQAERDEGRVGGGNAREEGAVRG